MIVLGPGLAEALLAGPSSNSRLKSSLTFHKRKVNYIHKEGKQRRSCFMHSRPRSSSRRSRQSERKGENEWGGVSGDKRRVSRVQGSVMIREQSIRLG
ncbi:hypothetical protein PoB_004064400 [Plakobranchus ocellatus]|uniref:Uncharacterized protein n=1 Tax=Plakobranchus ocellatus TaxID=259542 RepID=A0AAV4B628_9GAST|nr:hypothetical protein PoB_004064400 [Plakobranchus ocellatus]